MLRILAQHLVARRMAEQIVDFLEPVEIDQRDGAGGAGAMRARDLVIQRAHDAAAVKGPGEFVEFGEFLDALVGFLQLDAALVERFTERAAVDADEHAAADGHHEHQHRREPFHVAAVRHVDGLVRQQEHDRKAEGHDRP
jgi:hypothetical protein